MRQPLSGPGLWAALIAVTAGGCATSQGDSLMKRGAFMEAEAAYDAELSARPSDDGLKGKRAMAREQAFRAKLEQARGVRGSGHGEAALSILEEALRLEARWSLQPSAEVAALRDAEIAAAGDTAESVIRPPIAAKSPLNASSRAAKLVPLLDEPRLRPVAEKVKGEIVAAGKARCAELAAARSGNTPYLDRLVVTYCAKLGSPLDAAAPPDQRRGLRVSGRLEHATAAQHQIVEAWLAGVFRESPWFSADATEMMPLQLSGGYNARLERRRVMLNAPYKSVDRSVVKEGLLGPSATIETETERVFQYEAEEYSAQYDLAAKVSLELGGAAAPLVVEVKRTDKKKAYQHDVSFPRADVHPRRANLPDVNSWLTGYLSAKKTPLLRKLRGRWVKAFCAGPDFSPEEAARCLQARERRPAIGTALAKIFAADTDLLIEDFTRPPAEEAKAAGDAKAAPEVEEVPQAGGETI